MTYVGLSVLIALAAVGGFSYMMWLDGGWEAVLFVYGFTALSCAVVAAMVVLGMQGAYEMGWCPATECKLW